MNTKASFDAATLADAVGKAARVSPTKGAAFDQAAGLCFDIDPVKQMAVLKATNIDVTYFQRLAITDTKGDSVRWRIPSSLLSGLTANLPMGSGATVTFIDTGDGAIRIKAGTIAVKLQMISGDFPKIEPFDPVGLVEANDFAQKVGQVAWACTKDSNSVLSGVHIDGDHLIACDRAAAAMIPCSVSLPHPVTVPLAVLAGILRTATDVRIGASDRVFRIALDNESQATARLFEGAYPNVKQVDRTDYTARALIPRLALVESINRMMVVARAERLPSMKFTFNPGIVRTLTLDLNVPDTGRIQDTIEVSGDFIDPFEILFNPAMIVGAFDNSRDDAVSIEYGHPDLTKGPASICRVTDTKGYMALLTPRMP